VPAQRGGAADPERSTELLWGARERPGRRSKPGLSLERIVAAAVELADAEGLAALSMRRVAERLGFTTMSLYRHVPGKAELVDLMRDAVMGELPPDGADAGWRAGLEAWARQGWSLRRRHPWLVHSGGVRHLPGPNTIAAYERALRAASATGLRPSQVVAVVGLVGGFVESAARQALESAQTEQRSGVSEEQWWGARDSLWERLGPYPTLGRIWESGGYDQPEDPFEFGLQRVLDGIETLVRAGAAPPDPTRDATRDATAVVCAVCGKAVTRAPTGRPRDYCSRACQQRAYRRRRAWGRDRPTSGREC
jgi:AcrR family transcriptional regulator